MINMIPSPDVVNLQISLAQKEKSFYIFRPRWQRNKHSFLPTILNNSQAILVILHCQLELPLRVNVSCR
jgi:hypothetical protein